MPSVTMICLANSRKHGGRCVAGLKLDGSGWIRPVSAGEFGVLGETHYLLDNNRPIRPLDIVEMPLQGPHRQSHHPEDWLIAPGPWRFIRSATADDMLFLFGHLTAGPALLFNTRDRIPYGLTVRESLALIRMRDPRWVVTQRENRKSVKVLFNLSHQPYRLAVTDPFITDQITLLNSGEYPAETISLFQACREALVTVSLSEPFAAREGEPEDCYKLAACFLPCSGAESLPSPADPSGYAGCAPPRPVPAPPLSARDYAFSLFEQGLGIEQVAQRMRIARATALHHLAEYFEHEKIINPNPWVAPERFHKILEAARRIGLERLKPIYEALNGEIPYDDIRLSVACLRNRRGKAAE